MKPAPLRHPQLLNPPSICPQCGNKAWERTSPVELEERHCETAAKRMSQGVLNFDEANAGTERQTPPNA